MYVERRRAPCAGTSEIDPRNSQGIHDVIDAVILVGVKHGQPVATITEAVLTTVGEKICVQTMEPFWPMLS